MKNQLALYFLLLIFSFCLFTCDTNDPPPLDNGNGNKKEKKITLTIDDTSPTEIWLNLQTENIQLPDTFSLLRNNETVITLELFDSNYVIYEDSLLPSQSYIYQVSSIKNQVLSSEITAVPMDTTSHDFSYEVFEFGEHRNSVLRDVAIIDENNIWAVGAIYLNDSTGQRDPHAYNAVHWDGTEWTIKRIRYYGDCSAVEYPPLYSLYAFSSEEIVLTNGGSIGWFDGENLILDCGVNPLLTGAINKIWGTSSSNLYVVGGNGSIAHYNGTSWSKLESGTELTLSDVYGTNNNEVYASGVEVFKSGIVLKGNSSGFSVYKESGYVNENELFETLYAELGSVWVDEKGTLYTGGSYLYWQRRGEWDFVESLSENSFQANIGAPARGYITGITGNGSNDYLISGGRNTLQHYNGISWRQIGMEYSPSNSIIWRCVEQKGNLIIGVGEINNRAIIIKLKR